MNGFSAAISGVGSAIGRYFSIVSFVPSLFLAGFTFALIESGAWSGSGKLDWTRAGAAFTHIGNLAFLTLISIALGVAVHPIQFALVQFFEGYWGTNRLAQRVRIMRISHHRARSDYLRFELSTLARPALQQEDGRKKTKKKKGKGKGGKSLDLKAEAERRSIADESIRLAAGYPDKDEDMMPTRFGNVMRRYERLAGSQYGLDAVKVIRQIALVAPDRRVNYLNDQRQLLDLSIRMSATSIVATLIAVAFLWRHGPWLMIALVPYSVAYISYRGAIVVAHEYCAAFSAIIDLDRFTLYANLRMRMPKNTKAERRMNSRLVELLDYKRPVLSYEHPQISAPDTELNEQ